MSDVSLLLLLLALTAVLLLATLPRARSFIADRYARLRGRSSRRRPYTGPTIISSTGDEIPMPETRSRTPSRWAEQFQALLRSERLLAALVLILIGVLALQRAPRLLAPSRSGQFVVLVAPFYDENGSIGQTGRSVADQLVEILPQRSNGRLIAQRIAAPPADSDAALQELERQGANVLIWGRVTSGSVLDDQSLLPLLAYRPTDSFAPASWDGYDGRFAMPAAYVVASAPINGQAVLPGLLGALADYGGGQVDPAFTTLGKLTDDYPALLPALPRALRGNILWARGEYDEAAGEYRRALRSEAPSVTGIPNSQPLLANNLGAILQDAGDAAASDAFAQARQLAQGQTFGALQYNLGIDALRAGQLDQAQAALEQARAALPTTPPLLLALSEVYRTLGKLDQAQAAYDAALQQVRASADAAPPQLRDLTLSRLRAEADEQGALLDLAQLLQSSGPLSWQLEASPALPAAPLNPIRDNLTQAVNETNGLAKEWNRRSAVEDAADRPIAGLIAISQSRRAEQQLRERQRWLAAVQIEIARARGIRAPSGLAALWTQLVGDRSPLGVARSQLKTLQESAPTDVDVLVLFGRAQLLANDRTGAASQFDAAATTAPHRPEPVYGQALVAESDDRARARALLAQAIALDQRYFPARQRLAEIAQADQDWPTAIEQRRWLARERPSLANDLALAETLRLSGPSGYAEAERVLLRQANANNVQALIELGWLYRANGNAEAARAVLERAQRNAPNNPDVAYELGQLLAAQGDTPGATAQFQRAIEIDPRHIQARLALANLTDDPTTAAAQYRAALDAGASDPASLKQIGAVLLANGEVDAAISAYERAVKAAPDDPEGHHELARAYLQRRRFDAAAAQERTAIEQKGGRYPEALVGLGDIALARGDPQGAIQQYTAAQQQDDKLTAAYLGIGRANAAQDRWSVAVGQFQNAVNRDNTSAEAHLWLGEALIRQNDTDGATAEYSSALKLNPNYPEAYFGLAQAQMNANKLPEAAFNLNKALQLRPSYAEAWLLQGKLYQQSGDEARAIDSYTKAIQANGQLEEPHYRRALLYIRRNTMNDAESDLEAATRIRPNFPEAHYWLGRTYFAEGRAAAARDQFETAVAQRNGNYAEAHFYQGLAEEQLGQRADAAESFKAVLAQGRDSEWAGEAQAALARLGQP